MEMNAGPFDLAIAAIEQEIRDNEARGAQLREGLVRLREIAGQPAARPHPSTLRDARAARAPHPSTRPSGPTQDEGEAKAPRARAGKVDPAVMWEMLDAGKSDAAVAAYFGVSQSAICHRKKTGRPTTASRVMRQGAKTEPPPVARQVEETTSLEPVITFLRHRDFTVKKLDGGKYQLDRKTVDAGGLLEVANRHREKIGQPVFELRAP